MNRPGRRSGSCRCHLGGCWRSRKQYLRSEPTMSPDRPSIAAPGASWPAAGRRLMLVACISLLVAGCGGAGDRSSDEASGSSAGSTDAEDYQLLAVAYEAESGANPVIDP